MATKAERARAEQERSNKPPRPKAPKRTRHDEAVEAAPPSVRGRHSALNGSSRRNVVHRSTNSGGPALEGAVSGRPSRKSTRKSAGHVKQATNLTRRQQRKVSSPKERASRARAATRR